MRKHFVLAVVLLCAWFAAPPAYAGEGHGLLNEAEAAEDNSHPTLKAIQLWASVIGIPIAVLGYFAQKRGEKRDREYGTYNSLDDKYIHFLEVCLQHQNLDVFDIPSPSPPTLGVDESKQEQIIFAMLFAIMERAYLMYHDKGSEVRREQWSGWEEFMQGWSRRDNFRNAWALQGRGFDRNFKDFLDHVIADPTYISPTQSRLGMLQPLLRRLKSWSIEVVTAGLPGNS